MQENPVYQGSDPLTIERNLIMFRSKYEINPNYTPFMMKVLNYACIFVCDDSGSMREAADPDIGGSLSRWDELKKSMEVATEFHFAMNIPFHLYFINRGYVLNARSWEEVKHLFEAPPGGGTNLVQTLELVKSQNVGVDFKPPIIHIFTDGHPTSSYGTEDVQGFMTWLGSEQFNKRCFYSIVLCTDDEEIDRVYRRIERYVTGKKNQNIGIDITEDYRGETRDVKRRRGNSYRFTYGDYIVKLLCGAIDPAIHDIDLPDPCCSCVIM
jgi:hypothetical protein